MNTQQTELLEAFALKLYPKYEADDYYEGIREATVKALKALLEDKELMKEIGFVSFKQVEDEIKSVNDGMKIDRSKLNQTFDI